MSEEPEQQTPGRLNRREWILILILAVVFVLFRVAAMFLHEPKDKSQFNYDMGPPPGE
jgi:flagellar basal body-associated protein FliL